MNRPVQRVVVLGGGVAAAMAALAVARAFGRLGVSVTWVERGGVPVHSALIAPPDLATFHGLLGIEETALVKSAGATLNMGQQFTGWSGGNSSFVLAYGDAGASFHSLPFLQYWVRARQAGLQVPLEDFCLAAAAAKQGRTGGTRDSGQTVKHGHHLDAAAYAALLRAACVAAGVDIVDGEGVAAGGAGLALADGHVVEADFFIDADGALISALDPAGVEPGAAWCDRLIRASAPPLEPKPLIGRVMAHRGGWLTLMPLADRTAVEFAYLSSVMSDVEAAAALLAGAPQATLGEPEDIGAAHRAKPWVGNVVAIGKAAGEVQPLDGAELLLLQLAVAQLVLLWPLSCETMPEADIYNREMAGSRGRAGDFSAQHFRLNRRSEPFWEAARMAPISAELEAKIELFVARGMFAHFSHEAHVEDAWALAMTGHGLLPRSPDPMVWKVEEPELMAQFQRQLRAIAAEVRGMETHAAALQRVSGRPAAGR